MVRGQAVIFFGAAILAGFGYGAQGKGTGSFFSHIFGETDPTDLIRQLATEEPSPQDPSEGVVAQSVVSRLGAVDKRLSSKEAATFSPPQLSPVPEKLPSKESASKKGGVSNLQAQDSEAERLRAENLKLKSEAEQARFHLAQDEARLQERRGVEQQHKLLKERIQLLEKSQEQARFENEELKAKIASQEQQLTILRSSQSEGVKVRESSAVQIASLERENATLRRQVEQTKTELLGAEEQSRGTLARLEANVREFEEAKKSISVQQERLSQLEGELKAVRGEREEFAKKAQSKIDDKQRREKEVSRLTSELDATKKTLEERGRQLAEARQFEENTNQCQDQLLRAKNELVLARTELSTLTAIVTRPVQGGTNNSSASVSRAVPRAGAVMAPEPPMKSDVMIVQIVVPKANLRSGPGEEHSSVMEIAGGSRLTVEERMGDWYRVLTPTGSRAYVRRDLVTSADGPGVVSIVTPPPVVVAPPRAPARVVPAGSSSPSVPPVPPSPAPMPPAPPSPVKAVRTEEKNLDTKTPQELITRTDDDSIGLGGGAAPVSSRGEGKISEEELTSPPLEEDEKRALEILQRGIAAGAK